MFNEGIMLLLLQLKLVYALTKRYVIKKSEYLIRPLFFSQQKEEYKLHGHLSKLMIQVLLPI